MRHVPPLLIVTSLFWALPALAEPCTAYMQARGGKVQSTQITEASGLAASHIHEGVLWTHNDSGDSARLFALDLQGNLLATLQVEGSTARDWEDLASAPCAPDDPRECLYIADIGNNSEARTDLTIYRVPEPLELGTPDAPAMLNAQVLSTYPLTYPFSGDEAPLIPDAEALLVDRQSLSAFIITKEDRRARVLRIRNLTDPDSPITLVGELDLGLVTAGDMHPDGERMVVREYGRFYEFTIDLDEDPVRIDPDYTVRRGVSGEIQGEAVTYDVTGEVIYTLAEGANNPISIFECAPIIMEPELQDMPRDMPSDLPDMTPLVDMSQDMSWAGDAGVEPVDMSTGSTPASPEDGCNSSGSKQGTSPPWIVILGLCMVWGRRLRRRTITSSP